MQSPERGAHSAWPPGFKRRLLLSLASLIAVATIITALSLTSTRRSASATDPAALRVTLANGLRLVVVRDALAPVATTVVNYLAGSREAPPGFPGTAHAQEHMMFRGSPGLSAQQLAAIAAGMGGRFDADTQQTVTQYFFTVPADELDVALRVESIRMRGVLDEENLWKKERGAIEQEVARDVSSPEFILYTKLLAAMFAGTPYEHSPLGTVASFNQTTGSMLHDFYDAWYAPNNAILVVVGDVDPQRVEAKVRELFADIPTKKLGERPPVRLRPVESQKLHMTSDLPYGLAVVAFRTPGYDSPDFAATRVMADVLDSQRAALAELAATGQALSTSFSLDMLPAAGLAYAAAAFPAGGDGEAMLATLRKTLRETASAGVSEDLVTAAKRRRLTHAELQKSSVSGLAMTWSQVLAVEGRRSPEEVTQAVEAVTPGHVDRVTRAVVDLDHAVTAILTPQPTGKPISRRGYGGLESFAPTAAKPVPLPEWAKAAVTRIAVPTSAVSPTVFRLDNGLELIVQPESISDAVSIYGHIKSNSDLEAPPGQEGVDDVLEQLFPYGTLSLDRIAFQRALDDIGAIESGGSDFSLQVLAPQLERGAALLADNVLRPSMREEPFLIVRKQVAAAVSGMLQNPDFEAQLALYKGLFPKGDPSLRHPTPETVASLDLEDVLAYHEKTFRPDLCAIVVIGKVTPEQARQVVERSFGDWHATGEPPQVLLPPVPLNGPSSVTVPNPSRVQASVVMAETLGLVRSDPDYYALQLGNHVLSGAFYATRLYRDLREERGLVYNVSSDLDVTQTRGLFEVEYGSEPANVAQASAIVEGDLVAMQQKPVSDEELRQAKVLLLRAIPLAESSFSSIAHGLLTRFQLDLPLDEPLIAARHYDELTAEQVRAAYARWIRPHDLVQVTQGPAAK